MRIKPTLNVGKTLQDQLEIEGPLLLGGHVYEVSEEAGESLIAAGLATLSDAPPSKRKPEPAAAS